MIIRHIGLVLGAISGIVTFYLFMQGDYYSSLIGFVLTIIFSVIEASECYYIAYRKLHPICNRYLSSKDVDVDLEGFIKSCKNCVFNDTVYTTSNESMVKISEEIAESLTFSEDDVVPVNNIGDKATSVIS